tara:strand:+ start:1277 stop:1588 length:312 start_codon:yes stop_codon:yes gene_type:complete
VEIKTKKHFNEIIKSLTEEILDEEDLEEITTTGNVAGYSTPFAFRGKGKKGKKKSKEISTNSTDYELVKEALNDKDLKQITKLIREVVANILRDIWLKRTTWK